MKGAGTLALLVFLAAAAAVVIVATRPAVQEPGSPATSAPDRPAAELAVEDAIGLPFKTSPATEAVSPEVLLDEIGAMLDAQFGPGGLTRRTRAYQLLGLVPPGGNLRSETIAAEAAGVRGWFNPDTGRILLPDDFQPDDPHDRVVLHGLLTRALLAQHAPVTIGALDDDEWFARRSVYEAVAETVESELRRADPEPFRIPQAYETEREVVILGLPLFLHHLVQFPRAGGQARIFVETRVQTGARPLVDLIRDLPRSTFEILGGDPSAVAPPRLPDLDQLLLEESVGALGVQTLIEWLDDFAQARTLALLWRGDRYRLYANEWGDNLVWVCRWHSPEAATRAAEILARIVQQNADDPRALSVAAHGRITVFANCSAGEVLERLEEIDWDNGGNGVDYRFQRHPENPFEDISLPNPTPDSSKPPSP